MIERIALCFLFLGACSGRSLDVPTSSEATAGDGGSVLGLPDGAVIGGPNGPGGPTACVPATPLADGVWQLVGVKNGLPSTSDLFVGALGERIYFANGTNESVPHFFESFATDTGVFASEETSDSPLCLCGYNSEPVGAAGRLYYFANRNPDARVYDPTTRTWGTATKNPWSRGESAVATVDDRFIYYVGGRDGETDFTDTVAIYDAGKDAWALGPPVPRDLHHGAATFVPGQGLYVASAFEGGSDTVVYLFDPATTRWAPIPGVPIKFLVPSVAAVGDTLYLVDALGSDGPMYGRRNGTWTASTAPPPGSLLVATPCGGLYALLGGDASTVSIYRFTKP